MAGLLRFAQDDKRATSLRGNQLGDRECPKPTA
jgi:hypothetical protein